MIEILVATPFSRSETLLSPETKAITNILGKIFCAILENSMIYNEVVDREKLLLCWPLANQFGLYLFDLIN